MLNRLAMRSHFLEAVLSTPGPWGLRIERSGEWLATDAELAGTSRTRRQGLQGRTGLDADTALVIAPTQGVHTFGMQFPLDVVGVGRNGQVVSVKRDVPKRRIVLSLRAFAMVELASGACDLRGIAVGDRLVAAPRQHAGPAGRTLAHRGEVE